MTLKNYEEIDSNSKGKLLLGNGFSIGVSSNFSYSSLRQVCVKEKYLSIIDDQLFNSLSSNDFELLLNKLDIAASINEILGIDYNTPRNRYDNVRDALISGVKFVHPNWNTINPKWIDGVFKEFQQYEFIFTTNYDLLTYWIMGCYNFQNFTDYFWSGELTFDQFNTKVFHSKIPVLYLHGALFLYKNLGRVKKIKAKDNQNLLDSIEEIWKQNNVPVFVSEGSPPAKMNAIYSDPYLTFAFSKFLEIKGGLTVFGHSLSVSADNHIVCAINNNENLTNIAISIHREGKTDDDIRNEIDRITSQLNLHTRKDSIIEFFDSATSPFAYF